MRIETSATYNAHLTQSIAQANGNASETAVKNANSETGREEARGATFERGVQSESVTYSKPATAAAPKAIESTEKSEINSQLPNNPFLNGETTLTDEQLEAIEAAKALPGSNSTTTTESTTTTSTTEATSKGLSTEEVSAIKQQLSEQTMDMIKDLTKDTVKQQTDNVSYTTDEATAAILKKVFGSVEAAVPAVASTPEAAAAAIAPGGSYSVDAVADRLLTFAETMTGGDADAMAEMKAAVQQGFKEAGMDLETGEGMPDITYETYQEVMSRFDSYQNA
ncbi:MAG: hypothetical protein ATN35_11105 [Epulopiscium sp. Nele67-Bin004]|nr:MAG: hypothetical protein ATN35_11105 [Epulopiscium sp. Nele67-Bin004]